MKRWFTLASALALFSCEREAAQSAPAQAASPTAAASEPVSSAGARSPSSSSPSSSSPPPTEPSPGDPSRADPSPAAPSPDALSRIEKTSGVVEVKREGEPAVLASVRAAKNAGFDRVVFEFGEQVPGYHIEYIDKPVRDCGSGDVKPIDGDGWLEVRFYPARAHTEQGQPTVAEREIKPALPIVREIERTCNFEAVVTWVIGTASPNRYRAFELAGPPRLVIDVDH